MKRSEMVLKLYHWINYTRLGYDSTLEETIRGAGKENMMKDDQALSLMNLLEESGMEGPSRSVEQWVDCGDGQGFTSYSTNDWEEE